MNDEVMRGVYVVTRTVALTLVLAGLATAVCGLRISGHVAAPLLSQAGLEPWAGGVLIGAGLGATALGAVALSGLRRLRGRH